MKKVISFIAYLWAGLSTLIILSVFINCESYQRMFLKLPFMRIDPMYSGGEIAHTIDSDSYVINIHEPVFPALIGEGEHGFVQIDICTKDSTDNRLTTDNNFTIDFDNDNQADFGLIVNNGQAEVRSISGSNFCLQNFGHTKDGYIFRIGLDNLNR